MARPIDLDQLMKYPLRRGSEHCDEKNADPRFLNGVESILEWAQTLPTLTPPNEWVSVENALPPEHEPVLCIVNGKPKPNITLEDAYQLGSWNKADGWIIDEWLDWEWANVTWWMKLPAPPDRRPPEGEEGDADHV